LILEKLKGIFDSLGESEKRAARYILERPDDVIHYSITEFAHHCETSEATIYRLCRKLGFSGYHDFKIYLARELSFPREVMKRVEGDFSSFVEMVVNDNVDILRSTKEILDIHQLEKAVDLILDSDRLIFFGVGRSSPIAQDGSLRFALLGFRTSYYSDPHAQVMVAAGLSENDVVVAISHTGMIRDIVKSVQVAKSSKARTIAITAGMKSPLAGEADITLHVALGKEQAWDFLNNRIGEMLMIDLLYRCVLYKLGEKMDTHFENLREVLRPKRFK